MIGPLVNGQRPVDLVNPLVDSANSRWFFFSSATRPFGMVNLSPDMGTAGAWESGYRYNQKKINNDYSNLKRSEFLHIEILK